MKRTTAKTVGAALLSSPPPSFPPSVSYPGIDPTRGAYKTVLCESEGGLNPRNSGGADTVPRCAGLVWSTARISLLETEQERRRETLHLWFEGH